MKRHSFNLLELCLLLVFLTLISSVLTFSLPQYLEKRKFEQEIDTLETYLQAAQDWVLFSDSDIKLQFSFTEQGLTLESSAEAKDLLLPLPKQESFSKIQSIDLLHFKDKSLKRKISSDASSSSFSMTLSENGGHQEPVYLAFNLSNTSQKVYFIPGYPYVIQAEK